MSSILRSLTRTLLRLAVIGAVILSFTFSDVRIASAAQTAPGTAITNTATASYTDSNNQAYNTQSNTVTTTVQNAPNLTNVSTNPGPPGQSVSPGDTVVDSYTITNTGNGSGTINVPSAATITGPGTITGYTLSGSTTCTAASPCSLSALQTALNAAPVAAGSSATIGVVYTVSSAAITTNPTVQTSLTATITQAASGGVAAATSGSQTATETDTEKQDARIDLNKLAAAPTSAGGTMLYTIQANNGGSFGAQALTSAKTLFGATNPGIVILDKLPVSSGGTQQYYVPGSYVAPTSLPSGVTATLYVSTNGTTWSLASGAPANTDTYVALYLSVASGVVLPANPTASTGSGAGVTGTPQVTFQFGGTTPSGGNSGTQTFPNIANAVTGGNPTATGAIPIIAPGVPLGTITDGTATAGNTYTPAENNTTPSPANAAGGVGGASDTTNATGFVSNTVTNGPVGLAGTIGAYDGTSSPTNQLDFTAVAFPCTSGGTGTTPSINNGTTCTWPTGGVSVPNTITNTGTATDNFTISVTPPAGVTATIYVANACPATTTSTAQLPVAPFGTAGAECTQGTQLTTTTTGGVTTTNASQAPLTLASGASLNYIVVYTATSTAPFTGINAVVQAYGTTGTAGTASADNNYTYNTLYPGGVLKLTKSVSITTNGCPSGVTVTTVCPGGQLLYSLAVLNTAPAGQATNTGSANEPVFATAGLTIKAGTAVVTDDGTATGSSWFANSFGVDATPAAALAPTTAGATIAYLTTGTGATSTPHATGSTTAGPSGLTVTFGNAIAPGYSGTLTFSCTLR